MAQPVTITAWIDFLDPWSWVTTTRLERLSARYGDLVELEWRAFMRYPEKQVRDLDEWRSSTVDWLEPAAAEPGLGFSLWASTNAPPTHSAPALAAALVAGEEDGARAPAYWRALFRAHFTENRTISDGGTLIAIAREVGIDEDGFAMGLRGRYTHYVKQVIEEHNAGAKRGVTDTPAVVIGDEFLVRGAATDEQYCELVDQVLEARGVTPPAPVDTPTEPVPAPEAPLGAAEAPAPAAPPEPAPVPEPAPAVAPEPVATDAPPPPSRPDVVVEPEAAPEPEPTPAAVAANAPAPEPPSRSESEPEPEPVTAVHPDPVPAPPPPAKKGAAKKTPAKRTPAKRAPVKKAAAKKAAAKRSRAKKAPTKRAPAKRAASQQTGAPTDAAPAGDTSAPPQTPSPTPSPSAPLSLPGLDAGSSPAPQPPTQS